MSDTIRVHVTDLDGNRQTYEGLNGYSVMEVIRDNGLPIKAECGGCMCCATCAVDVAANWVHKIPQQSKDERDMIEDSGVAANETTRLSCQIVLGPELDGIAVTLRPDAVP